MSKKKIKILFIIVSLLIVFLLILLAIRCTPKVNQSILSHTSANEFSDDAYTIFFAKDGRGPNGDGSVFEIYSVKSDGSSLTFEKNESSEVWGEKTYPYGISESMGRYSGDFQSPDGKKNLIVKSGWFGGWFAFFSTPKLYVEQNGQKDLLMNGGFGEVEWLPDSRRVVFANGNQIGLIDTESKKIAYLADGAGWIWVEKN